MYLNLYLGSTLVILQSSEEPNNFFGGMAVPPWRNSTKEWVSDPNKYEYSWLFKIEIIQKQLNLLLYNNSIESVSINENALARMLFLFMQVTF